jgi:hypothetical protein
MRSVARVASLAMIGWASAALLVAACGAGSASHVPDPSGAPAGFADKLCAAVDSAGKVGADLQRLTAAGAEMAAVGTATASAATDLNATDAALAAIPDWERSRADVAQWRGYLPEAANAMKAVSAAASANAPAAFQQAFSDAGKSTGALQSVQLGLPQLASDLGVSCGSATS